MLSDRFDAAALRPDVTDVERSRATLSDLGVYLHVFNEGTKQMGRSYFFPSMFVFNCFPMKTNVSSLTPPSLFSEWH